MDVRKREWTLFGVGSNPSSTLLQLEKDSVVVGAEQEEDKSIYVVGGEENRDEGRTVAVGGKVMKLGKRKLSTGLRLQISPSHPEESSSVIHNFPFVTSTTRKRNNHNNAIQNNSDDELVSSIGVKRIRFSSTSSTDSNSSSQGSSSSDAVVSTPTASAAADRQQQQPLRRQILVKQAIDVHQHHSNPAEVAGESLITASPPATFQRRNNNRSNNNAAHQQQSSNTNTLQQQNGNNNNNNNNNQQSTTANHQFELSGCLSPATSTISNHHLLLAQSLKLAADRNNKSSPNRSEPSTTAPASKHQDLHDLNNKRGTEQEKAEGEQKPQGPEEEEDAEDENRVGDYLLLSKLDPAGTTYHAFHTKKRKLHSCQVLTEHQYRHFLSVRDRLNLAVEAHDVSNSKVNNNINDCLIDPDDDRQRRNSIDSVIALDTDTVRNTRDGRMYLFSPHNYGSLHGYIQARKKLSEDEARGFYGQIVRMVEFCHSRGIIVRDLKLRKFVFTDEQQTQLRMTSVNDVVVCPSVSEDTMEDRHGCPAYVSPEILDLSQHSYSGKAADIWSLGVLLFVMLLGRYPFYDQTPAGLFGKIRAGKYWIPSEERIGMEGKLLLRSLLRRVPDIRPTASELADMGWFRRQKRYSSKRKSGDKKPTTTSTTVNNILSRSRAARAEAARADRDGFAGLIPTSRPPIGLTPSPTSAARNNHRQSAAAAAAATAKLEPPPMIVDESDVHVVPTTPTNPELGMPKFGGIAVQAAVAVEFEGAEV